MPRLWMEKIESEFNVTTVLVSLENLATMNENWMKILKSLSSVATFSCHLQRRSIFPLIYLWNSICDGVIKGIKLHYLIGKSSVLECRRVKWVESGLAESFRSFFFFFPSPVCGTECFVYLNSSGQ